MALEKKALEHLQGLLNMSKENFEEMSSRWDEFEPHSLFDIKNTKDFQKGYVFGKIEHKFISWFYSEYGRSQTEEEYREFWNITMKKYEELK